MTNIEPWMITETIPKHKHVMKWLGHEPGYCEICSCESTRPLKRLNSETICKTCGSNNVYLYHEFTTSYNSQIVTYKCLDCVNEMTVEK